MANKTFCDHCGKEIADPSSNFDMTQLTTWEDEGGLITDGQFTEITRDFCDMKCTARFTHGKLLKSINGQQG